MLCSAFYCFAVLCIAIFIRLCYIMLMEVQYMAKKQKQNDAQITVRVPSELRVDLEAIAKKQGRSLSNLVIHILKSYVENN